MGAGQSKSKSLISTENNQNYTTSNEINSLNDKLTNISSETMINTSKTCSNSTVLQNVIDFSDSIVKGNFTLDNVKLSQDSLTSLSCVQASEARVDVASALVTSIMEELSSNTDTALLTEMDSVAESTSGLGLFAFGNTDSKSKVDSVINTNVLNENTKNLQNLVETVVSTNVTEEDMQACISKVNQIQGIDASGSIIGGSVDISNYESSQVATNISDCLQDSSMISATTQDIFDKLGVTVVDTVTTESDSYQASDAESTAKTGLSGLELMGGIVVFLVVGFIAYMLVKSMNGSAAKSMISQYQQPPSYTESFNHRSNPRQYSQNPRQYSQNPQQYSQNPQGRVVDIVRNSIDNYSPKLIDKDMIDKAKIMAQISQLQSQLQS